MGTRRGDSIIMGDIAEAILDGTLCEVCGVFIDMDSPGYPRACDGCKEEEEEEEC